MIRGCVVSVLLLAACGETEGPRWPAYGTEHREAVAILDAQGLVAARGWARRPLFAFDREAVPDPRAGRIREWDFYAIHTPGFSVMVTLAEIRFEQAGHFAVATVSVHDFATRERFDGQLLLPESSDLLDLLPTSGGNYRVESGAHFLAYEGGAGGRVIRFSLPMAEPAGATLSGSFTIELPDDESIALVTPWAEPGYFFYENKVLAMPVTGAVGAGERRWEVPPGASFAIMDWVRAVVGHTIDWTWATGVGVIDGRRVGLNLGSVFGDETDGTPDAVILDGVMHKLPPVSWDTSDAEGRWRFTSDDGRVDLALVPNGYRETQDLDLGFYKTTLDKPCGTWSGTVVLDSGEVLDVDGLLAAAERVHTEW